MGLFSHKPDDADLRQILGQYQGIIEQLVEALFAGDPDVALKLAAVVEGCPSQVRVAIVEKMREMVVARDAEKARALDAIIEQQKLLEAKQKAHGMQQWLAYVMSQDTLRKIRESLLARPGLQKELEHIGQDLAKRGVLQQLQPQGKQDLGGLSANVQDKGAGRDTGKGR
jgi:hypothetical protein